MRWLLVVLGCAGCGRFAFDPTGDATGSATTDGDDDGALTPDCWAGWRAGTVQVGTPRLLDELTAGVTQGDPSLTSDGLTLYFNRGNVGPDIYYATRPTRTSRWTLGGPLNLLTTTFAETKLTVSTDGMSGVFSSDRNGGADLFLTARSAAPDSWAVSASQTVVQGLNSAQDEFDPDLTADGLHLYYAPDPGGGQQIVVAARQDVMSPFTIDRIVSELALGTTYSDPTLSPDELVIAYAAMSNAMLFYATRTTKTATFGTPVAIPSVHGTTGRETDAELSSDGCELYFSSTRSGGKDVYVSVIVP